MLTLLSFLALNGLIAGLTWWRSRRAAATAPQEYFLNRRRLSAPLVMMAVLMTNFSAEQLVGLNGEAYRNGATAIAWEMFGALGLVLLAVVFLPRYSAAGVTTIPQFVEERCGRPVRRLMSLLMLTSLVVVGVPFVLYSGTLALVEFFGLRAWPGLPLPMVLGGTAAFLAASGLGFSLLGGMRSLAISDVFYAVIFFGAALLVPVLGLWEIGSGSVGAGLARLAAERPAALNPFGGAGESLPPSALLTGMVVINLSAWCVNQSVAQKAFAASSLVEGQKGLLLAAVIKLTAPLFFVLPGLIAAVLFAAPLDHPDTAYARLVQHLLPDWLTGFFAAAVAGATITSVSGLLHSGTTLLAIDLLRDSPEKLGGRLPAAGRWFAVAAVLFAVVAVPLIAQHQSGYFVLMKRLNATLTLPVVSVVACLVLTRKVWPRWAIPLAMVAASGIYLLADLLPVGAAPGMLRWHWLHAVALSFGVATTVLLISGRPSPSAPLAGRPAMSAGWPAARLVSSGIAFSVLAIYAALWTLAVVN